MAATPKVIDMTNVKDQGEFNPKRVKAGDYRAKIVKVDDHASGDSKVPNNWVFTIKISGHASASYPYYVGWEDKYAWKIRKLCIAVGLLRGDAPKKRTKVDPNRLVGKELAVAMDDDEYEGRVKSTISNVFPVSELTAGDEPDDTGDDNATDETEEIDEMDLEEV